MSFVSLLLMDSSSVADLDGESENVTVGLVLDETVCVRDSRADCVPTKDGETDCRADSVSVGNALFVTESDPVRVTSSESDFEWLRVGVSTVKV